MKENVKEKKRKKNLSLKFSLSAKEHKSLNFRIGLLLKSTKANSEKLNFLE